MATYALTGYGAIVSADSGSYAACADGTGDFFLAAMDTSADGLSIGQISSAGGTRIAYQSFLEFDASDLTATPTTVGLDLGVWAQYADPALSDQYFGATILIAEYDWGGAPITDPTAVWLNTASLDALTPCGSASTIGYDYPDSIAFTINPGAISTTGPSRFIVYLDVQASGTESPLGGALSDSDGFQEIAFISPDTSDAPTPLLTVNGGDTGPPDCTNPQFIVSAKLRAYLKLTP